MAADALVRHDSNGSDTMLLDMLDPGEYEPSLSGIKSPSTKRKASDLKIEGPLTPLMFSDSPAKKLKTVAFADMLVEYIPDSPRVTSHENGDISEVAFSHRDDPELPSNYENGNDILSPDDDYAFLKEVIQPAAEDANWRVENEKLSEADTIRRMPVPHVDFKLPTAPWDEFHRRDGRDKSETEIDAQAQFLLWVKRNHFKSVTSWHGVSELDRMLPLAPFPHESGKVSVEEKLHGDDVLTKILADMAVGEISTSTTGVWKRVGLRLLEDEEQYEEKLTPADLGERRDMGFLVKKRQLELQGIGSDRGELSQPNRLAPKSVSKALHPRRDSIESHHWRKGLRVPVEDISPRATNTQLDKPQLGTTHDKPMKTRDQDQSLMFGGKFSATSALDNFMAVHGMTVKPSATGRAEPLTKRRLEAPLPSPIRPTKHRRSGEDESSNKINEMAPEPARKPLDLPQLPEFVPPCSFVISSILLQRRSLSKQIEDLYPNAEFVCRDFDSHLAVNKEADLVLSPSTGLILTTLQQLKQRSLPGQPERSPVKERMLALKDIYERLVVLVSEGLSRDLEGFGQCSDYRDEQAINEYERFAAGLDGEMLVRYVAGGETALARSVVIEMARFGLPHGSQDIGDIKLLSDQTNVSTLVFLVDAKLT